MKVPTSRALLVAGLLPCLMAFTGHAAVVEYQLEPTHTFVNFEVLHAGLSTQRGRFNRSSGRLRIDRAAQVGEGEVSINLTTVDTGHAALDAQLRAALDVEKYPTARVVVQSMRFAGDQIAGARGELSLRGQTDRVDLTATHFNCYLSPLLRREICGGEFEATLEPARWGIVIDPALDWASRLTLRIQVEAVPQ